jgi:hypothetical protein
VANDFGLNISAKQEKVTAVPPAIPQDRRGVERRRWRSAISLIRIERKRTKMLYFRGAVKAGKQLLPVSVAEAGVP